MKCSSVQTSISFTSYWKTLFYSRKSVAVFDAKTGKRKRDLKADFLHPIKLEFLGNSKIVVLGNFLWLWIQRIPAFHDFTIRDPCYFGRVGRNPSFFCFYHPLFFSDKSCFFASQNLFFWEGTFPHTFFSNKSCFSASKSFFYQTNFFCGLCANKIHFFFIF